MEELALAWDLSKAYNAIHTRPDERHMRCLVWRWGVANEEWTTYALNRMHVGDRPVACALEVAVRENFRK